MAELPPPVPTPEVPNGVFRMQTEYMPESRFSIAGPGPASQFPDERAGATPLDMVAVNALNTGYESRLCVDFSYDPG